MAMFQTPFLDECFAKVVQSLKALRAGTGLSLQVLGLRPRSEKAAIQVGEWPIHPCCALCQGQLSADRNTPDLLF